MARRRTALLPAALIGGAALLAACASSDGRDATGGDGGGGEAGRGTAREPSRLRELPSGLVEDAAPPGVHELRTDNGGRPALLFVPETARQGPVPLIVYFHGAGGKPRSGVAMLRSAADELGAAILAPASRGRTWDAVGGDFGGDAAAVDRALQRTARRVRIDRGNVIAAGFSDGASYALGLGLANGRLFDGIAAFSPGFIPRAPRQGRPEVFITHGKDDRVLPIDRTSRQIVPRLRDQGYEVTYREFEGDHEIPADQRRAAVERLLPG